MRTFFQAIRPIFSALSFVLTFQSCSKTEYEELKRPYADISQFTVASFDAALDSIHGVIKGDSILVYWSDKAEIPARTTPRIQIAEGASIQPKSGESVEFSEQTVYTVTAEDGTKREFKLIPLLNKPTPSLLGVVQTRLVWVELTTIDLTGQYFLEAGTANDIKVFAKRMRDGVEFEMPLVASNVTPTNLRVSFPTFAAEYDEGIHQIWAEVKDLKSNAIEIYIERPWFRQITQSYNWHQQGQNISAGQEMIVDYAFSDKFNGAAARYYTGQIKEVILWIRNSGNQTTYMTITNPTVSSTQFKFTLPPEISNFAGQHVYRMQVRVPQPTATIPDYLILSQFNTTQTNIVAN